MGAGREDEGEGGREGSWVSAALLRRRKRRRETSRAIFIDHFLPYSRREGGREGRREGGREGRREGGRDGKGGR